MTLCIKNITQTIEIIKEFGKDRIVLAVSHYFLIDGKNGCEVDKDLGFFCCRYMMKRLSKEEINELTTEKKMFESEKKLLQNFPDVPKLPGKTFFRVSEFADIKKRKDGLQSFLRLCIERKDIFANEDFKLFVELVCFLDIDF